MACQVSASFPVNTSSAWGGLGSFGANIRTLPLQCWSFSKGPLILFVYSGMRTTENFAERTKSLTEHSKEKVFVLYLRINTENLHCFVDSIRMWHKERKYSQVR